MFFHRPHSHHDMSQITGVEATPEFEKSEEVMKLNTIRTLQNSSAARIQITRAAEADPHSANSDGGAGRYLSILKDGGGHEYVAYAVHIPPTPDHQFLANSQDSLEYGNVQGDPNDNRIKDRVLRVNGYDQMVVNPLKLNINRKRNQRAKKTVTGDVLNAKVNEVVGGEMVLGKTVTDDATPKKKKRKRNKKIKKVVGDILSAKIDEMVSGILVRGYLIVATLVQNDYVTMTSPQEVTMFTHECARTTLGSAILEGETRGAFLAMKGESR
nr:cellulose synthase-like protein D5 [Tanacetum cinerariifolium]